MIEVKDLHKVDARGKVNALNGVTFTVEDGEIFGVIGPDGAGKSSLFRILASLLLPDSGSVTMNGHDVVKDYRKVRQIIGYMPGRFSLLSGSECGGKPLLSSQPSSTPPSTKIII